jgi:hypothetical protein
MDKQNNQQNRDAERKSNFIERNSELYLSNPIFKMMVDETVYFTQAERQESMTKIGGQYQDGKFLNL